MDYIIDIPIEYNVFKSNAYKHLAIMAKRITDKDGKPTFSKILPSTAEDSIIDDYSHKSIQQIVSAIKQLVVNISTDENGIETITIKTTRFLDDELKSFVNTLVNSIKSYVLAYTLSEYLSMNYPDFAKKYTDDCKLHMSEICNLCFFKKPPYVPTQSFDVVCGEIGEETADEGEAN